MFKGIAIILIFVSAIYYTQPDLFAFESGTGKNKKTDQNDRVLDSSQSLMNINNLTSWVTQEGYHDWLVGGSWNGSFPINYYIGTIFSEGIVWGGKVFDGFEPLIRVNGNTYATGCSPLVGLYRVRTNYQTADLTMDAATYFNITPGEVTQDEIYQVYMQYQTDWNEWPANEGAPYKDVNENGIYEAYIDIPGVPSASQTIFIKYDDSNSSNLYGSPPIGLEISETYWTFSGPSLNNTIFKKIDVTYTGGSQPVPGSYIDSMFICQWSDPDVGNSTDDYAGCDTTLNLGYSYNANSEDAVYQSIGLKPPASGYVMLQGVSTYTGNASDSAIFNFKWRKGYRYSSPKPMNSFVYIAAGGTWNDPNFTYTGTLEFYNLMRGYLPDPPYPSSLPFPESVADYTTSGCYLLTGDPVNGTGKIDGIVDGPGDRRIVVINGPFHMSLGDTVEAVVALTSAVGNDFLSSITELRKNAVSADSAYQTYVDSSYVVAVDTRIENNFSYSLSQNYPNPFNPVTVIGWQLSEAGWQTLKIYDVLGKEIATLVNEYRPAGKYEVKWNAASGSSRIPSGVYFYQLKSGSYVNTKKMILLK